MEIYINDKLVKAQILPVNKPTLDETLETFSFALISNNQSMPYAPCQSVKVITDSNETINLFLVTDSVEIFSLSPARYKHSITCVQNTRKLSKHLVRNSVFSQPAYLEKKGVTSWSHSIGARSTTGSGLSGRITFLSSNTSEGSVYYDGSLYKPLQLSNLSNYTKEKIKDAYFELKCIGVLCDPTTTYFPYMKTGTGRWVNDIKSIRDIIEENPSTQFEFHNLFLEYKDRNGQYDTIEITDNVVDFVDGWYPLNTKIKFNAIKTLAEQGCDDFRIVTYKTGYPRSGISGTFEIKSDENFWMIFACQAVITVETYYYNVYEILDILRERQVKQRDVAGTTIHDDYASLYMLPGFAIETELETLMKNTPAPNFIFTQSTLYECLADVFRLFDGIFTLNQYNELGIDYFNNNSNRDVTNTLKKVGQNTSSSEDKYTNGLVANYQDARTVETFPTLNNAYATIKTKELAVPSSNNSFILETPHNIDHILNLQLTFVANNLITIKTNWRSNVQPDDPYEQGYVQIGDGGWTINGFPNLEISDFVVMENLWTLENRGETMYNDTNPYTHLSTINNPFTLMQINTVFFKQGTNQIDISYTYERYWWHSTQFAWNNLVNCALWCMFGAYRIDESDNSAYRIVYLTNSLSNNWRDIRFNIKYLTTVDGRTKVESIDRKYDGETLIDQYNGAVDLNRMGLNILGLSLKLGNPTLTVTQKITTWNNRIKQGDIYYYQSKKWIANVVSYTIFGNGYIQATIQFVQNFNALAMRTQLLREKRMSNISSELTVKSEENIIDYIYYSFDDTDKDISSPSRIAVDYLKLAAGLFTSLAVSGLSTLYGFEVATFYNPELNYHVYLPMIKYGAGNMVCFEMGFEEPMSAGKRTKYYEEGWFLGATTQYFTDVVNYTDNSGFVNTATIRIYQSESVYIDNNFPQITTGNESGIAIDNYKVYKQPNEVFALNYELCFLPIDKELDFIGSKFINDNFFINSLSRTKVSLKFYYGASNFKYSVLDLKGEGNTDANIVSITPELITTTKMVLKITLSKTIDTSNFALCEANGDILFASNRTVNTDTLYITFVTSNKRVDNKVLEDY